MLTPEKYVQPMGKPVPLVVAMTISLVFAWKTENSPDQIPDPKVPETITPGNNSHGVSVISGASPDETRSTPSGATPVQLDLTNDKIFITPTCTSQRSNNVTRPLMTFAASRIYWKHKSTTLLPTASRSATSQTYHFPRQGLHSYKSSFKLTQPLHATRYH